jgi:glycerophosphoryl diester phosphodiesterase
VDGAGSGSRHRMREPRVVARALVALTLVSGAFAASAALAVAPGAAHAVRPEWHVQGEGRITTVEPPLSQPEAPTDPGADDPSPSPSARSTGAPRPPAPPRPKYPGVLVIGHRGAPAYRPQHTLQGYQVAIDEGADYVETDLVSTKDGELIARHERDLTDTTDVRAHPELASLAREGRWYAEDLTLAQVQTLHATGGPAQFSGKFGVPTLAEIIALVHRQHRRVGLYAETKDPAYLRGLGLPLEEKLASAVRAAGWAGHNAPVFLESFDSDSLMRLHKLVDTPLVQLQYGVPTDAELAGYATYASAVGIDCVSLRRYLPGAAAAASGGPGKPDGTAGAGASVADPPSGPDPVTAARAHGLAVHVFTLGARSPYGPLAPKFSNPADPPQWATGIALYRAVYTLGVTAVFSDSPNVAVYARG